MNEDKMKCISFFWGGGTPTAYGGSQARGPTRTVAACLFQSHSNAGSELRLQPSPQLTATPGLQPTRARPGIEPATSWFPVGSVNHCATMGTPEITLKWCRYILIENLFIANVSFPVKSSSVLLNRTNYSFLFIPLHCYLYSNFNTN